MKKKFVKLEINQVIWKIMFKLFKDRSKKKAQKISNNNYQINMKFLIQILIYKIKQERIFNN